MLSTSTRFPLDRKDLGYALAVAAGATVFHLLYFNHGVHNLVDLALMAVDADRILDGQVYGIDFQAPYGPGRYYLLALVFSLFGESLFVMNCVFLVVLSFNHALTYLVARFLMPRRYALFAALLGAVAHGSIHKAFLPFSALVILLTLFSVLHSGGKKGAFRFGLVLAAVTLLRWDVGVMGGVAALIAFLSMRCFRQAAAKAAAGFSLLALPSLGFLLIALDPMAMAAHVRQRIWAFSISAKEYTSWSELLFSPEWKSRIFVFLALVLFLGFALSLAFSLLHWIKGRHRERAVCLFALCFLTAPLLNQVNITIRFNRLLQAAPLLFICFCFSLHLACRHGRKLRTAAVALGVIFSGLLLFYLWEYTGTASQDSFAVLRYKERYLAHPRIRCHMRKGLAGDIDQTLSFLDRHARPEDLIFTGPACPLLYFMADRINPTPFTDWPYYFFDHEAETQMLDDLEKKNVRYYVEWRLPVASASFEEACPRLAAYLRTRFKPVAASGRLMVMHERD